MVTLAQMRRLTITDSGVLEIDRVPLLAGVNWEPYQYVQVGEYVLVKWRRTLGDEATTGENLWQGDQPMATGGGELPLWSAPASTDSIQSPTPPPEQTSVWNRIDSRAGSYGLPRSIAQQLRDPANLVDIVDGSTV